MSLTSPPSSLHVQSVPPEILNEDFILVVTAQLRNNALKIKLSERSNSKIYTDSHLVSHIV